MNTIFYKKTLWVNSSFACTEYSRPNFKTEYKCFWSHFFQFNIWDVTKSNVYKVKKSKQIFTNSSAVSHSPHLFSRSLSNRDDWTKIKNHEDRHLYKSFKIHLWKEK